MSCSVTIGLGHAAPSLLIRRLKEPVDTCLGSAGADFRERACIQAGLRASGRLAEAEFRKGRATSRGRNLCMMPIRATSLRERAGYLSALYDRGASPLAPLWATQRQRAVFGCRKRSHCGRNLTRGSDSTPMRWRPVWQSRQSPNDASACQTTTALGGSLCESLELECVRVGEVRLSRRWFSAAHSGLRRRLSNPTTSTDKSVPARCSAEMLVASEGRFPAAHSNRSTVSAGSYGLKIQRIKVSLARMRLVRDGP